MESAGRAVPVERPLVRRGINLDWDRVGGRHVETAESLLPLRPHIVGIHYPYLCAADTRGPQSVELHRPVSGCERKKEGSTLPDTLHSGHGLDVFQLRAVHYGRQTIRSVLRRWRVRLGSAFDSNGLGDGAKNEARCSRLLSPGRRAPTYVIRRLPMVISQVESQYKIAEANEEATENWQAASVNSALLCVSLP